jgi:predicted nucleic acid-binding Zn ribbon protein
MSDKSKNEIRTVGQAIRELLNSYQLESKFDETNVVASWEKIVGKPIAKRTRKVFIKSKVLYVEFDSPAMKHDFHLHKAEVMALFQKEFGDTVKEIVVL